MKTLELYYPAKRYNVTQAFGIKNDSYLSLGFSRHNGIDFSVDEDGIVLAMCDGEVVDEGYNDKAGNYVKYKTIDQVLCEGVPCYVTFMYMHGEKNLVEMGDILRAGDQIMRAGNTGFSTGPHTHISAWRTDNHGNRLDIDPTTNYCFNFAKYYNGFFADHAKFLEKLRGIYVVEQLFRLMKRII